MVQWVVFVTDHFLSYAHLHTHAAIVEYNKVTIPRKSHKVMKVMKFAGRQVH